MAAKITNKVNVRFISINTNQVWTDVFNQATFFNFDTANPVIINSVFTLAPASGSTPTFLEISLNTGEESTEVTKFVLDFGGSASANLVIIIAEYEH